MAIVTKQFERIAEIVTTRTADLFTSPVCVVDEQGIVVAGSLQSKVGRPLDLPFGGDETRYVRVPIRLDGQDGEVVVLQQPHAETISPRLARVLIELVVNQTALVDRLPSKHELKNKFIYDLLHGSRTNEAEVLRESQILSLDLVPPRLVVLIDAADYILAESPSTNQEDPETVVRRRAQVVIGAIVDFFELPNDTICAYIGEGEVAVLKASNRRSLQQWLSKDDRADPANSSWANLQALKRAGEALLHRLQADTRAVINIGIGRYHPGFLGLARSYQDARAALSLGRRFRGGNQVHCLDALGIPAFVGVADERTKIDLATYLLSPLDHEPDLMATVEAFFAHNCSPSETARTLSIHRNTLTYRLDKITSLTGLDPRSFDSAVQIRLALVLRSLESDTCASAQ